jgi:hypothetical protein
MDFGPVMAKMFAKSSPKAVAIPELFIKPSDNLCPLKMGDQLFSDAPDAEPNEKIQFRFEIVLHEPGVIEGKPLLETLVQFRDRVSSIIEAFRSCLS